MLPVPSHVHLALPSSYPANLYSWLFVQQEETLSERHIQTDVCQNLVALEMSVVGLEGLSPDQTGRHRNLESVGLVGDLCQS